MKIMNKILLVLGVLFVVAFLGISFWFLRVTSTPISVPLSTPSATPKSQQSNSVYTLDYSEGSCKADTDCTWESQGCGGGHGICTNNPEKYKDLQFSTCDFVPNFPSNKGFACGCIADAGKCGWKK